MNKERRKRIADIVDRLDALSGQIGALRYEIEGILEEEHEYFENMPDSLRDSERGRISEDALRNLEAAMDYVPDGLEDAISSLQAAAE